MTIPPVVADQPNRAHTNPFGVSISSVVGISQVHSTCAGLCWSAAVAEQCFQGTNQADSRVSHVARGEDKFRTCWDPHPTVPVFVRGLAAGIRNSSGGLEFFSLASDGLVTAAGAPEIASCTPHRANSIWVISKKP